MESKHWTQDEVNYLINNHLGKKSAELASDLNRPIESVKSKLSRLGLKKPKKVEVNTFNKKPHIGKDARIRSKSVTKKVLEAKKEIVMIPVKIDRKTTIYIKSGENPEEARTKYLERIAKPQTY
jgi:hypothetical protein